MPRPRLICSPSARAALIGFVLIAWPPVGADAATADTSSVYPHVFDEFFELEPDPGRMAEVSSLLLERDAGTFVLEQGRLALTLPIGGRVRAAAFVGHGRFRFTPTSPVEREQLRRFFKVPVLVRDFQSLLLVFGDSTAEELAAGTSFKGLDSGAGLVECLRTGLKSLGNEKRRSVDPSLAQTLLEDRHTGYFGAIIDGGTRHSLRFEIDPLSAEEVFLAHVPDGPVQREPTEIVCQFPLGGRSSDALEDDERPDLTVSSYTMEVALTRNRKASIVADLQCEVLRDSVRYLHFWLLEDLAVDSVRWGGGQPLRAFRFKEDPLLWVDAGRPLMRGEQLGLRIRYGGTMLEEQDGVMALRSSSLWYPRHGLKRRAAFDLTFRYPRDMSLVSVGDQVSSEVRGKEVVARWRAASPTRNASWHVGFFKEQTVKPEGLPEVTVLISKSGHQEIGRALIEEGVASGKDMEKQVAADVVNSLSFFTHVYGPLPLSRIRAAESPAVHGEAFAGMVTLGTMTFQRTSEGGGDEILRAHEVAHQWWPFGVEYKTYHDQWLSEGLADFSGLWYMQLARRRNELYFGKLEEWRQVILQNRGGFIGGGQEAGPVWLGRRTQTTATPFNDFAVVVYEKGAWVFHMLRNYLLDLDTMNEDRFVALMRDFYASHKGGSASTADFRRAVEKHAGEDMGWFFRQWVYGTAVPTYRFAWTSAPADSGKYRVRCRIEQRGVPDDFQMRVPIRIDFGNDRYARLRVLVKGKVSEPELPLVPQVPKKVVFNDLSSVLCTVDNVPW